MIVFIKNTTKLIIVLLLFVVFASVPTGLSYAQPTSTNFVLDEYGFGAGAVATSSSESFMFQGIVGEIETASLSSETFILGPGLTYTLEPNTPAAPTVVNLNNYYNKLHVKIDNGGNSTDTTFLIQVASGSADFTQNTYYVQADNTLGADKVWQTYTLWGGATGFELIGLKPNSTYYVRVAARKGTFQQGQYSLPASDATSSPNFTFFLETTKTDVPPLSIELGALTPGSVTTSSTKVVTTISTNSVNGGLIYIFGTNNGLKSTSAGNYTINSTTNDLSSVSEGYGARGIGHSESLGGPMQLISPYDGTGDNVGILDSTQRLLSNSSDMPVTFGQVYFELKAKASDTTPGAIDYTDILTVIGTGAF